MDYISTLPRELRDLLYRYVYHDNLLLLNRVYKSFEALYTCDMEGNLLEESKQKKEEKITMLFDILKIFNIKCYSITKKCKSKMLKNCRCKYICHWLEIDSEAIITDDLLFKILSNTNFLNYIKIRTGFNFNNIYAMPNIANFNQILKENKMQIYIHPTETDKYNLVVFKTS